MATLGALLPVAAGAHTIVTTTVLFNREVAKVLDAKCAHCHVTSGMAMPLQSYEQTRPWAESIKQEIIARRMPPWPAERGYGAFANDSSLTPREQQFLLSWIDGGLPEGAGERPELMDHSGHWMLGPPDNVVEGIADGTSASGRYQRYVVDLGATGAMPIRALDLKIPGHMARAAFVSVLGSGQYIGGWTPSHGSIEFPAGSALHLDAGAKLAIDVLQPDAQVTLSPSVALYLSAGQSAAVSSASFSAVAQGDLPRTRLEARLEADMTITGFRVEVGQGARALELNARTPDGEFKPLLLVREYRPEWGVPYLLTAPMLLPKGSTLTAVGIFDDKATGDRGIRIDLSTVAGSAVDPGGTVPDQHQHVH